MMVTEKEEKEDFPFRMNELEVLNFRQMFVVIFLHKSGWRSSRWILYFVGESCFMSRRNIVALSGEVCSVQNVINSQLQSECD